MLNSVDSVGCIVPLHLNKLWHRRRPSTRLYVSSNYLQLFAPLPCDHQSIHLFDTETRVYANQSATCLFLSSPTIFIRRFNSRQQPPGSRLIRTPRPAGVFASSLQLSAWTSTQPTNHQHRHARRVGDLEGRASACVQAAWPAAIAT
jgi:hypothetical protein